MKTSDFYYDLPHELIAQTPLKERSKSRMLVLDKKSGEIDYEKNYLPQKKVNNPFVFSSTPNQVQLDFNNLSSSNANKLGSNIGVVNSGNNNAND